jgi:exopolyphosphatase / guanosine-5'-triphosphate,3'-diphosphate pyrophosphatase
MLCGCIDIGTNTTRVLVAEARAGRLTEVLQRRAFTRLGRGLSPGHAIPEDRIHATAEVVSAQHALAVEAGASPIRTVATAVIRRAANAHEFCAAIRRLCGIDVSVLDGEEEARLAFLGATRTLGSTPAGRVAVVDVGGGSTEIAAGTLAAGVEWSTSLPVGSGVLADRFLASDPPTADELLAARTHALRALDGLELPEVETAVAVGGSAASLRRLVGPVLDRAALDRALAVLQGAPAALLAARYHLEEERVRLLPAGLLALGAAAAALDQPLRIGNGGMREGILLDLARNA